MKQYLKMQPTFRLESKLTPDDLISRMRKAIDTPRLNGKVDAAGNCFEFSVDQRDRRFWSPHLSDQISETQSGSLVFGRLSPRPEIWTMFMAIYAIVLIAMFGGLILAYVQWSLGTTTWALAVAPLGIGLLVLLHVTSLIGQNLSSDQMQELRARLDLALSLS